MNDNVKCNQLEVSVNGHAVPRFSIFKSSDSKEKVESLLYCFMKDAVIDSNNPPANIKADDGWIYQAVYDSRLGPERDCPVLISFQRHTYGRFAVIRARVRLVSDLRN